MLEPSSPEPIRLRRRLLASGTAVGSLVMTVWALGALIGNAQTAPNTQDSAAEAAVGSQTQSAPAESSGLNLPAQPLAAPASESGQSSEPAAPAPASSLARGKPLPECAPGQLQVDARPYQGDYRAGETPRFQLAVTNTSGKECYADFSSGQRDVQVLAKGGAPVWSTSDSAIGSPMEVHRLSPDQSITADIDGPATVPHGVYAVVGEFGQQSTAPHRFLVH